MTEEKNGRPSWIPRKVWENPMSVFFLFTLVVMLFITWASDLFGTDAVKVWIDDIMNRVTGHPFEHDHIHGHNEGVE